jgi:hypothetical protein
MPGSPVAALGHGGLAQQLDSLDLTGAVAVAGTGEALASKDVAAKEAVGIKLEQQMTVVTPPPPIDRQASASPFSAFTAGPDFLFDDDRGL